MWKNAIWLGLPVNELKNKKIYEGDLTGRFAYYRCECEVKEKASLVVDIAANSRYRLWVNAVPVLSGPCKGDEHRCYYDTVGISEYLTIGKNVFAVQVLYCNPDTAVTQAEERASIFGVRTPGGGHRLAVEGNILDNENHVIATVTTGLAPWKVYLDDSFYLKSNEITINLGAICEEIDYRKTMSDWKLPEFSDAYWSLPRKLDTPEPDSFLKMVGLLPRFQMQEREIPLLYEREELFLHELCKADDRLSGILEKKEVRVPAGECREIILDAGVIKNGYPRYSFSKGANSKISFTYFEKFSSDEKTIRKDDVEQGEIVGLTDWIVLDGKNVVYEPFWYRTFRFLRIRIEADAEDVVMSEPVFRRTGYPLQVESWVSSSVKWVGEVWDLCVRTLENCMTETYMDCPYYEQMQFPMDTRLQAIFNYAISTDARLAKKALKDYHYSMLPEGLIPGKYPSAYCQVISTFSLHYIYMLLEYVEQTKDLETVRPYFPDIDLILGYYDRRIGTDGLVGRLGYWEFVDWQEAWKACAGIPAALQEGPSTIINLMYAYALQCAARLNEIVGRYGLAEEYLQRQKQITETVERLCWDEDRGMYREGPNYIQYSQHAQAWAVLNNMGNHEKQCRMMARAMSDEDVLRVSFATAYEWFRALEITRMYAQSEENMLRWAALRSQGCTSCPEEPTNGRSDNHAWSALPLYEFIRVIAGIRSDGDGWERVRICPHMDYLPDLKGEVATPKGVIRFVYQREDDKIDYHISLPEGLTGKFVHPDGKEEVIGKEV